VLQVLAVIERRVSERVPAAYITNEAWLGTYNFYVDERVLVPRSFIAELIPNLFSPWVQDPDGVENVLELCTGSGCLAIMMADAFPNAVVDAVDISKDALAVAERNIRDYKLEGRVNPIESDLYENVPFKKYDLIVTNPPYVNADSMGKLPPEYLREPQIALAGGDDGMDLVRKIVAGAAERLTPEGILVVEIGNEREFAEAAFGHLGLTWLTTSRRRCGVPADRRAAANNSSYSSSTVVPQRQGSKLRDTQKTWVPAFAGTTLVKTLDTFMIRFPTSA
jgi:ribosomal protein L3 glutamine methyltransferase